MWQTDIFTFRLGGINTYIVGFLNDYSLYMVGIDIFPSQVALHILEVYRTTFEAELHKGQVRHINGRSHYPMTLGKIEQIWNTIWEVFLVRAQFDSLESVPKRRQIWVKHNNGRKPIRTEHRHIRDVHRELVIHPSLLYAWEKRALAAMFKVLEPPTRQERRPSLSPKLERLPVRQTLQQNGRME